MPRSEASIDQAIVKYARDKGCLVAKLGGFRSGSVGWPDRLFVGPNGQVFFIEMKREGGGRLSAMQEVMITELQERGISCYIVSDVDTGKALVDRELGA